MVKINNKKSLPTQTISFQEMVFQHLRGEDLVNVIRQFISKQQFENLRMLFDQLSLAQASSAFSILDEDEQVKFFRMLTTAQANEFFVELDLDLQAHLISIFQSDMAIEIVRSMKSDEISDLIEELPDKLAQTILLKIDNDQKRREINEILNFEDNQVGSIMSVEISKLNDSMNVRDALKQIKKDYQHKKDLLHYFFVVDENQHLVGAVRLEDLLFSEKNESLEEIMFAVEPTQAKDKIEVAAALYARANMSSIPVVDVDHHLVGVLNSHAMFDAIRSIATEAAYIQAGISTTDSEVSYMKQSTFKILKSRIFWLILLLVGSTFSQIVVQIFSDISAQQLTMWISVGLLTSLIPVLTGAAGNSGSQSIATITRASALGEFKDVKMRQIFYKEFLISIIIGAILLVVNFARLAILFGIDGTFNQQPNVAAILIALSSLSIFLIIIVAKFLGTLIPLVTYKLKRDPAPSSAPILSSLSDGLASLIFFGMTIGAFLLIFQLNPAILA